MADIPEPIPDPLQHAGNSVEPKHPRPRIQLKKTRTVITGEFLAQTKRKKKPTAPDTLPRVTADPAMVETLAQCGKWAYPHNRIRFAIWHCLRATPELASINDEDLWDRLGRWGSETRGIKESPEINERHQALGHLQRLLLGVRATEANPQRAGVMRFATNKLFKMAIEEWENALGAYLNDHPECMLTHDEFAGFVTRVNATEQVHKGLLERPGPAQKRPRDKDKESPPP